MPTPEDFEIPDVADLDGEADAPEQAALEIPDVAEEQQQPQQAGTGSTPLDFLLGLADGATLNHGRILGRAGEWLGNEAADLMGKGTQHTQGIADELHDQAGSTVAGKVGKGAGLVNTGALAAMAAPATVPAQAAAGALTGGLSAAGSSEYSDPFAVLTGAGVGGALGGAFGAMGQGARALGERATLGGVPTVGTKADQLLKKLAELAPKNGPLTWLPEGLGMRAASGALTAAQKSAPVITALGGAAAAGAGTFAEPSKAQAQDKAYGTAPTMAWAVQSVLTSGDTGLAPADEQQLTEAVLSGDDQKVITVNFMLQQKNPGYAKRMRRELESLQESE